MVVVLKVKEMIILSALLQLRPDSQCHSPLGLQCPTIPNNLDNGTTLIAFYFYRNKKHVASHPLRFDRNNLLIFRPSFLAIYLWL
jgi:hypothetical protein